MFIFSSAIQCSALSPIDNGVISYNPLGTEPFGLNTEAIHTCAMGYFLSSGSDVRVCGGGCSATGVWSGTVPTCTGENKRAIMYILHGMHYTMYK